MWLWSAQALVAVALVGNPGVPLRIAVTQCFLRGHGSDRVIMAASGGLAVAKPCWPDAGAAKTPPTILMGGQHGPGAYRGKQSDALRRPGRAANSTGVVLEWTISPVD
jgi:hypothetical protein